LFSGNLSRCLVKDGTSPLYLQPSFPAADPAGNIWISDFGGVSNSIRVVTPAGVASTYSHATSDGPFATALFAGPTAVTVDSVGVIYVADGDGSIRKVVGGMVSTFVPKNIFIAIKQIIVDLLDNLIVVDISYATFGCILRVDKNTAVITGIPPNCFGVSFPAGAAQLGDGSFIVSTFATLFKVLPNGMFSPFAGGMFGYKDGVGGQAQFGYLIGETIDGQGNIYVGDNSCGCIRKISPTANVTSITAQNGFPMYSIFNVVSDNYGNIYFIEYSSIWVIPYTGGAPFLLVGAFFGFQDGNATTALFNSPSSLAMLSSGQMLVADTRNRRLRLVQLQPPIPATTGVATTRVGTTGAITTGAVTTGAATTAAATTAAVTTAAASIAAATTGGTPTVPTSAAPLGTQASASQKPISSSLKLYVDLASLSFILIVLLV